MSDTVRAALLRAQAAINDAFTLDAANTPPPDPKPGGRSPADVLNLRNWKLTLPTTTSGKVTEIRQPKLATYTDRYFAVTDAGDGVALALLRADCARLGVEVVASDDSALPAYAADAR